MKWGGAGEIGKRAIQIDFAPVWRGSCLLTRRWLSKRAIGAKTRPRLNPDNVNFTVSLDHFVNVNFVPAWTAKVYLFIKIQR